jgi:hypothetical protein
MPVTECGDQDYSRKRKKTHCPEKKRRKFSKFLFSLFAASAARMPDQ